MFKKAAVLLLLAITLTSSGNNLAENITFKLSFEKGLTPETAAGSPAPTFLGNKELLKFAPGLGSGKGLVSGIEKQAVRFNAEKNINPAEGTVTFWVKGFPGVKWNQRNRKFYIFFQWMDQENIRIYKYHLNPWTRFYEQKNIHQYPQYTESNWNFFAFSWNGVELKWYLNGQLVGTTRREKPFAPSSSKGYFEIGQSWGKGDTANRIMDELVIFNKALTETEILSLYAIGSGMPTTQCIRVGSTLNKIKIDGKMEPKEWDDASTALVALDSKTKSVAETISRLYLTYDKDYLYFYFKSPIPQRFWEHAQNKLLHGFFKRETINFDHNVDFDDSLELRFKTNVGKFIYRMLVNTIDVKYDYRYNESCRELKWNPRWITKTSVSEDGWHLEGKIAFADISGTPADGAVWEMNFYRIWKKLKTQVDAWSNDTYEPGSNKFNTGQVIFGGKNNIAVKVNKLVQMDSNGIDLELLLTNTSPKAEKVLVQLTTGRKSTLLKKEQTVPPNESVCLNIKQSFGLNPPARLNFIVSGMSGKTVYWVQETPIFNVRDIILDMAVLPIKNRLIFSGEFAQLGLNLKKTEVRIALKKGTKLINESKIRPDVPKFKLEMDTGKLDHGKYAAEIELTESGKVIATKQLEYIKETLPEWLGNSLGIPEKVPPPWTPVKYENNAVQVLGRQYIYHNNGLFPAQIEAAGKNILAAPMSVNLQVSGKDILKQAGVKLEKLKTNDLQTSFVRVSELKNVKVELDSRVEFDGMMWNSLRITPREKNIKVNALSVIVELNKQNATLMMPHDYTLQNTGAVKKWAGSIRPLWIGDEKRGLCFFAEHSYNWIVKDRQKELEVIPQKDTVLLRINLIDSPVRLEKTMVFQFGFMATPIKPVRKEYRQWRFVHQVESITPEKDVELIQLPFRRWSKNPSYETCYPVGDPNMRPLAGKCGNLNWSGLLYYELEMLWSESPEFKMFGHEWSSDLRIVPPTNKDPDERQLGVCPASKSYQDFILYSFKTLQEKFNPKGFYFDVSQPKMCYGRNHGCGYVVDGEVRPTFNILGTRELVKRIYIQQKAMRPDAIIAYHISGKVCLPVHGFADVLLDGENFISALNDNRGYQKILTLDTYRAEYMGHNFGVAVTLLPEFRIAKKWSKNMDFCKAWFYVNKAWLKRRANKLETPAEKQYWSELAAHTNYILGLSLLHDNPFWVAYTPNMAPVLTHYRILADFNYAGEHYKFVPYWEQKIAKIISPGKAVVSFYISPEKTVAVVMNLSDSTQDVSLKFDSYETPKKAQNLEYKEEVILNNGVLTIKQIPPHQYRVILLDAGHKNSSGKIKE